MKLAWGLALRNTMKVISFATLAAVVLGSRQTFLSFGDLEEVLNTTETIANDFFRLDIEALEKDWEGKVLHHAEYPRQAVRIKEPKICDSVKQYSGYLDTASDKHFFFWFFESRGDPKKTHSCFG
ncbi:hypothetical protein DSO57_1022774 [Entomophthora muscae]|uniref:Uncharacterized protein n=1 Tax=Entomophthora muscae TaxID=34485 RepID=A0ACC2T376_9FUNG|nr:hypothetical protein DSO57_1022774 [Entomophthora muscae]